MAVLVGLTGMTVKVPAPVAVHEVPTAFPLHGWAGSTTEMVNVPAEKRLFAFRRTRAPVEAGGGVGVVLVLVEVVGSGNRILICPEVESRIVVPPAESMRLILEAEEILGASR